MFTLESSLNGTILPPSQWLYKNLTVTIKLEENVMWWYYDEPESYVIPKSIYNQQEKKTFSSEIYITVDYKFYF